MTDATRSVPFAPLTAAGLRYAADRAFSRSGRWVAHWLQHPDLIGERRRAWANAERAAAQGLYLRDLERERGGALTE